MCPISIYDFFRLAVHVSDASDLAILDSDVAGKRLVTSAINDRCVLDEIFVHSDLLLIVLCHHAEFLCCKIN